MLHRRWRICARMLAVDLPIRVLRRFKVRSLPAWLAHAPSLRVRAIFVVFMVLNAVHVLMISTKVVVFTTLTRSAPGASSGSFVMSGQCITTRKPPTALVASMWPLTSM